VQLEVPGQGTTKVTLSDSFWRRCSELRCAALGRWLREIRKAPWPKGHPPTLVIERLEGTTFRVGSLTVALSAVTSTLVLSRPSGVALVKL
jgi:hypothetical protein